MCGDGLSGLVTCLTAPPSLDVAAQVRGHRPCPPVGVLGVGGRPSVVSFPGPILDPCDYLFVPFQQHRLLDLGLCTLAAEGDGPAVFGVVLPDCRPCPPRIPLPECV